MTKLPKICVRLPGARIARVALVSRRYAWPPLNGNTSIVYRQARRTARSAPLGRSIGIREDDAVELRMALTISVQYQFL